MTAWPSPRLPVFVSSTIGECAPERAAARVAIESIKCDPVLFEAIGARPHPARVTYMEGLGRSQICIIIWKESYGWIDPAIGISGIEDEFRIARERQLDLLIYIKAEAPKRDDRLSALIEEARSFVTTHSYVDETALQDQISGDITSLLSQAFIDRTTRRADRLLAPAAVLAGSMPLDMVAVERPALEGQIDDAVKANPRTWLTGAAGAGKTILLAQWASSRRAAYVNARGLSLRQLLGALAAALSKSALIVESLSIDDAAARLRAVWNENSHWPLVIDDPTGVLELLNYFKEFGDANGSVRVVIGAREPAESGSVPSINVPGLTSSEAAEVISRLPHPIRVEVNANSTSVLPLDIRKRAAASAAPQYLVFDEIGGVAPDPKVRELLAFVVASPEPLTLEDLASLTSSEESAVKLDGYLATLSFLLIDDGLGFRPVHDEIAKDLQESLGRRPGLKRLVSSRLAQFFAKTGRFLSAFEMYEGIDAKRALRLAYRAASQASMGGQFAFAIRPMEFIVAERRKEGKRFELAMSLIALGQALDMAGSASASGALEEAERLANELDDAELRQAVADHVLTRRIRRELKPGDLAELSTIKERYKSAGRLSESARLAIEEGSILISVGK